MAIPLRGADWRSARKIASQKSTSVPWRGEQTYGNYSFRGRPANRLALVCPGANNNHNKSNVSTIASAMSGQAPSIDGQNDTATELKYTTHRPAITRKPDKPRSCARLKKDRNLKWPDQKRTEQSDAINIARHKIATTVRGWRSYIGEPNRENKRRHDTWAE